MTTYNVRHKKTGNIVRVDDAFKETCDKHGYDHAPKAQILAGVDFDSKGRIIRPKRD